MLTFFLINKITNLVKFLSDHKAASISVLIAMLLIIISFTIFALYKVGANGKHTRIEIIFDKTHKVNKESLSALTNLCNACIPREYLIFQINNVDYTHLSVGTDSDFCAKLIRNPDILKKDKIIFQFSIGFYIIDHCGHYSDTETFLTPKNAVIKTIDCTTSKDNFSMLCTYNFDTKLNKFHDFIFNCGKQLKIANCLGMEKAK